MFLSKVKIKDNEVEIHYGQRPLKTDSEETVFRSYDKPSPEFLSCLQPLKSYLLQVLELDEDYGDNLTITGLTVKHENPDGDDDENYGCVISGVKNLEESAAPFCLNTPYIPPNRNENTKTVMDEYLADDIRKIEGFCERFIQGGERAQGELFK